MAGTLLPLLGDTVVNPSQLRLGAARLLQVHVQQLQLTLDADNDPPFLYAGCEVIPRQRVDIGKGMHFVTEYAFGVNGDVVCWELFSADARTVQLQAWRWDGYEYGLVGETSAQIRVGYNRVELDPDSYIPVRSGDVLGWYMPDWQTIPYSEEGRRLLVRRVDQAQGQLQILDMSNHKHGWCRTYSVRATVRPTPGQVIKGVEANVVDVSTLHNKTLSAVVSPRFFGHHPLLRGEEDTGRSMHIVTEYAFDDFGRVVEWQFYSKGERTVQLQVWRPDFDRAALTYVFVRQVEVNIIQGHNTIALTAEQVIQVAPGDVIGWFMRGVQSIPYDTVNDCPNSTVRRAYGTGGDVINLDVSDHAGWCVKAGLSHYRTLCFTLEVPGAVWAFHESFFCVVCVFSKIFCNRLNFRF